MKITKLLFTSAIAITSIAALFHSASASAQTVRADSIKIMSRASCSRLPSGDVGHAAIAFYDNSGRLLATRGMWPGGVRTNDPEDIRMANGNGCGLRTRTASVSASRREWAWNQVSTTGGTNCQNYFPVGGVRGKENDCSCVNYATRVWRQVTSDWERWQFQTTPKLLGDTIQSANGRQAHGKFDNGRVWQ